ncbi:MAG: succinylglutamate desuccinylase/aspartoacylase family protein [Coriobacteriales bacterium]|nr:succinylglutamate desuccinylase/aspartoacylase family protein [Coriobacteriales bacterium]
MISTVFSAALPMGESLAVQRNRITGMRKTGPRIALVTGMHGNELVGQYVTYELTRRLTKDLQNLSGVVDIYPALNPLGLSMRSHGVPQFDIDLDRTFPGNPDGNLTEALAAAILADISGSTACIIVQSSDEFVQEISQARVDEKNTQVLVRLASLLNLRLVWVQRPTSSLRSTLAHTLNKQGTPSLVIKMGSDMRQAENESAWFVEGILRLLSELHAWSGPTIALPDPKVSGGNDIITLLAEEPGLFLPRAECGTTIRRGQTIGLVVDPLEGVVRQELKAPSPGLLFALRTYPVVYPGSLIARVLED